MDIDAQQTVFSLWALEAANLWPLRAVFAFGGRGSGRSRRTMAAQRPKKGHRLADGGFMPPPSASIGEADASS